MPRTRLVRAMAVIAFGLAAVLQAACSGIQVTTDYDPDAPFDQLATYAWIPASQPKTGDPRVDNSLVDSRIRNAVDSRLQAQGFRKVDDGPVDFHVGYHLAIETKLDIDTINNYYGPGWGGYWGGGASSSTFVSEYDQGSLIIDVLDPQSHQLLWRGSALAEIVDEGTPEKRDARTQTAVTKVLEKFPPDR